MSEMVPKDELDKARDQVNKLNAERGELEQAYQEVESHKITDSLTIAAIYKLMILKGLNKL